MEQQYWDRALADNYRQYALWLEGKIQELQSVETLPLIGARREIRARQIAIGYLKPTAEKFRLAADQHSAIADVREANRNGYSS